MHKKSDQKEKTSGIVENNYKNKKTKKKNLLTTTRFYV